MCGLADAPGDRGCPEMWRDNQPRRCPLLAQPRRWGSRQHSSAEWGEADARRTYDVLPLDNSTVRRWMHRVQISQIL